jgi:hypothetical protein
MRSGYDFGFPFDLTRLHRPRQAQRLDLHPHACEILQIFYGDGRSGITAMRLGDYQSLGHELRKRFADGTKTDAEALAILLGTDLGARRDLTSEDTGPQGLVSFPRDGLALAWYFHVLITPAAMKEA